MKKFFYKLITLRYIFIVITVSVLSEICIVNAFPYHNSITTMTDENNSNNNIIIIEKITTEPKIVNVSDDFNILVTAINKSPNTISYLVSDCLGKPLYIDLISNNIKKVSNVCPQGSALLENLKPGQKTLIKSVTYKAVAIGPAKAIITMYYRMNDNSPFNISTSKTFLFSILSKNTNILP
jgi:hypothetical protein